MSAVLGRAAAPDTVLEMVPLRPNEELIRQLRIMLEEAEKGHMTGLAFSGFYRGGLVDGDVIGAARREATIGLLITAHLKQVLEEELRGPRSPSRRR